MTEELKSEKKPTYYITTPIYYPSGKWHLGHCYTTIYGDAIARFKRMAGFDVFYLTGTDEHGQKIEKRAAEAGVAPKAFVDSLVAEIQTLWAKFGISYDKFIRTTDGYHIGAVQKIFKTLYDKGDIYKSKYKGKYCTPCEAFWTETQAKGGICPDCGRPVADAEEESYFFRLSKYQDRIKALLTETDFLQPSTRVNEMVNNFINEGLADLAVSRTSFTWGVPVEFDKGHIVYVWVDALSNYITALGYDGEDSSLFDKFWPADLHLMAKEIVRFHTIIWPAILMALDLPLPKKVVGHGWLLFDGDKMSKSKGNVVDPFKLLERYGADSLRYYLLRSMPFGADGQYSNENLLTRINTDLSNDLGNLVKRTLAMARQYFDGVVDNSGVKNSEEDDEFLGAIEKLPSKVAKLVDDAYLARALEEIFDVVSRANKYIDVTKPWTLNKEGNLPRLKAVIYNLVECIRVVATYLLPFIPSSAAKIFDGLGLTAPTNFDNCAPQTYKTTETDALFPRLDIKKEMAELELIAADATKSEVKDVGKSEVKDASKSEVKDEKKDEVKGEAKGEGVGLISIDKFFETSLRVATVIACEKVPKTDKLLKLTVTVGLETRTVVSGIAKSYSPEEMIGKQVVLVANLQAAKLRGIESEGMILCATDGDKVVLVSPEKLVESGAEVC